MILPVCGATHSSWTWWIFKVLYIHTFLFFFFFWKWQSNTIGSVGLALMTTALKSASRPLDLGQFSQTRPIVPGPCPPLEGAEQLAY